MNNQENIHMPSTRHAFMFEAIDASNDFNLVKIITPHFFSNPAWQQVSSSVPCFICWGTSKATGYCTNRNDALKLRRSEIVGYTDAGVKCDKTLIMRSVQNVDSANGTKYWGNSVARGHDMPAPLSAVWVRKKRTFQTWLNGPSQAVWVHVIANTD